MPNPEPVVRVVSVVRQQGRGLYWRGNGAGYTNRVEEAGLYAPAELQEWETWAQVPMSSLFTEIDEEIAALEQRLARLRTWKLQVLCSADAWEQSPRCAGDRFERPPMESPMSPVVARGTASWPPPVCLSAPSSLEPNNATTEG